MQCCYRSAKLHDMMHCILRRLCRAGALCSESCEGLLGSATQYVSRWVSDVAKLLCSEHQQQAMRTSLGSSKDASGIDTSTIDCSHHLASLPEDDVLTSNAMAAGQAVAAFDGAHLVATVHDSSPEDNATLEDIPESSPAQGGADHCFSPYSAFA